MIFWHFCLFQEIRHFFRRFPSENHAPKTELLSHRKFLLDIEIQANLISIAFTSVAPAVHSVDFPTTFTFLLARTCTTRNPNTAHSHILPVERCHKTNARFREEHFLI